MLARDHALSGALTFTAVAPVLHVTGAGLLAGAVFTAGAATAPDIDEPGSTISRTLGFFTEAVSWVVHKISGGHRKGTHSVLGVAMFTFAAWVAVAHATTLTGKVILGVVLGVLLSAGVRALRIGGHRVRIARSPEHRRSHIATTDRPRTVTGWNPIPVNLEDPLLVARALTTIVDGYPKILRFP